MLYTITAQGTANLPEIKVWGKTSKFDLWQSYSPLTYDSVQGYVSVRRVTKFKKGVTGLIFKLFFPKFQIQNIF